MFKVLQELFDFIYKAVVTYAASDEGKAELNDIAQAIENMGIDVPFWQPSEGEPLDVSEKQAATDYSSNFRARHPELFPEEGVDA